MCNCKQNEFELIPEVRAVLDEYEMEFETRPTVRSQSYVKDFSGPAGECVAALARAGKNRAQALGILNSQISTAIRMLRIAAAKLEQGKRTAATSQLFRQVFGVQPSFVPQWLKQTTSIRDRGYVVARRCQRIASLLASGRIKYFCSITAANCPDCGNDNSPYACSSWGSESANPQKSHVICLGRAFWDDVRKNDLASILSTVMHEPFHIYFGKYVTEHDTHPNGKSVGKFGGIDCIIQFVFRVNGKKAVRLDVSNCDGITARTKSNGY